MCRKGRLILQEEPRAWLSRIMMTVPIKEAPITFDVALETGEFEPIKLNPVDRLLIATARTLELTLVSADREIIKTKRCAVLPNR